MADGIAFSVGARAVSALGILAVVVLIGGGVSGAVADDLPTDVMVTTSADSAFLPEEAAAAETGSVLEPWFGRLSAVAGFEDGGLTADGTALLFHWNGVFPEEGKAIVDEARAAGVDVEIRFVKYTWDEAYEYGRPLAEAARERGIEISLWGPNRTNDALEFAGPKLSDGAAEQNVLLELSRTLLPEDISVVFTEYEDSEEADSRHSDTGDPNTGGWGSGALWWHMA